MWLSILFGLVVGLLGLWFVTFWHSYRYLKQVPSMRVWPLVGNALEFGKTTDILNVFMNMYEQLNAKTIRIHFGFRTILQTKDYKFLEYILTSQTIISKGIGYEFLHSWLGLGLLTANGERWRRNRKMMTPTFHFQILEQFIEVFNANGNIMIERLEREVDKPSFDAYNYVTLCALDIICETAMGTCVNAQREETSDYAKAVKDMSYIIQKRGLNPLLHNRFIYQFSALARQESAALKILHGYTDSVIAKRRQQLKESAQGLIKATEDELGRKKRTAFLDMLLQATYSDGTPMTDMDIRQEVDTFMFEGHDTTAAGICYTLFNLASHPECQKKAVEELREMFGDDLYRDCTHNDLHQMKYLEMVIKETLRLFPSVPMYGRLTTEDIYYDGMIIPKNTTISMFAYGMHRDPEYFPDPERFDPERFSPENYDGKQPFSFIPFSAGLRNCIGQKFAMMEMKATVSKVLRNYELLPATPTHHLQLASELILKAKNGVRIAIRRRDFD